MEVLAADAERVKRTFGGQMILDPDESSMPEPKAVVQIAFQRPPKFLVDFRPILVKRLWHTGSGLRPRPVSEKAAIARAVEENVWPLIAAGKVKPVICRTFPLREAAAAHALMETSAHIGKIVLTV